MTYSGLQGQHGTPPGIPPGLANGYPVLPLSDTKLRAAKPQAKAYRLPDGGGLHLWVTPTGIRSWRYRYEVAGREQTHVLGRYPAVSLADARRARDAIRDRLAAGLGAVEAPTATASTFAAVARDWHAVNAPRWKPHHAADVLAGLEANVFPVFGATPVDQVTPLDVLRALRPMEARGAVDTSRRLKQRCSAVFGFAMSHGYAPADPTARLLSALAPLPRKGRRPALLDLDEARTLLARVDAEPAQPVTKIAMRVLALTAVRPGEVAELQWCELHGLDGPEPVWLLPAARMKMGRDHVVPLSRQAVEALAAVRRLTGRGAYAFPNLRNARKPMSENALGYMLLRLDYRGRHVAHGWRATFSTLMNERYPADRAVIDLMLAHLPQDAVERAYNRAEHLPRRRFLAQAWADLLLNGAQPADALLDGPRKRVPKWED